MARGAGLLPVQVGRSSRDIRPSGVLALAGERCPCPSGTGLRSASLRPRGKRVRHPLRARHRGARDGRRAAPRPRAHRGPAARRGPLRGRARSRSPGAGARTARGHVTDGLYAVRLRTRGLDGRVDTRMLALRRSRGRVHRAGRVRCAGPRAAWWPRRGWDAPAFGGRRARGARAALPRSSRRARVAVTVTRRGRRGAAPARPDGRARAGRHRVRLAARGRRRGEYRVRIVARAGPRARARSTLAARRL